MFIVYCLYQCLFPDKFYGKINLNIFLLKTSVILSLKNKGFFCKKWKHCKNPAAILHVPAPFFSGEPSPLQFIQFFLQDTKQFLTEKRGKGYVFICFFMGNHLFFLEKILNVHEAPVFLRGALTRKIRMSHQLHFFFRERTGGCP